MPEKAEIEFLNGGAMTPALAFKNGDERLQGWLLPNDPAALSGNNQISNSACGRPCHNCEFRFSCASREEEATLKG